jgi:hypothetical protein
MENIMAALSLNNERFEWRLDRLERLVASMTRLGMRWRSEANAHRGESDRAIANPQ